MEIVTKIIDFRRWHPAQTYTMFASEKVSERNENCRFQPAYVRKAIAEKSYQIGEFRRVGVFPSLELETLTTGLQSKVRYLKQTVK